MEAPSSALSEGPRVAKLEPTHGRLLWQAAVPSVLMKIGFAP